MDQDQLAALAKQLLNAVGDGEIHHRLTAHGHHYFWQETRGGGALLVDPGDGSVLFATSGVDPTVHESEFERGRRTPLAEFDRG